MLKRLLIVLAVFAGLFVAVGLWLPAQHRVERSVVIERSAADIFTLLNSFEGYQEWLPWIRRDAAVVTRITGADAGPGARVSWNGDPRLVGTGLVEIEESTPFSQIDLRVDLGEQGAADLVFRLSQQANTTELGWVFLIDVTKDQGFFDALMGRYLGLLLGDWVGAELEQGLDRFKGMAESLPPGLASTTDVEIVTVTAEPILFVTGSSSQAMEDLSAALSEAFSEISVFLEANGLEMAGQPMAITRAWDETGYQFDAAVPIRGSLPPLTGRMQSGLSPDGPAVRIIHRGPYEEILQTYEKLAAFMAARGLTGAGVSWEHYVTDPTETAPADLVTLVYVQLAEVE